MEKVDPKVLNSEVRKWAKQSKTMMQRRVARLTNKNKHVYLRIRKIKGIRKGRSSKLKSTHLKDSISQKVLLRFGIAERIIFPFAKHGYFLATGASRGHSAKSNPRKIINWYNFVFEKRLDDLADTVTEHYADAVMNVSGIGKKL